MLSLIDFRIPNRVGPITASVAAGQHIAIIGPNGSGKSSLLLGMAGLVRSTGQLLWDHQDIRQWSMQYAAVKRAMLPQRSAQLLPITCNQVIALGAMPLNVRESSLQSAIEHVCSRLELSDYLNRDFSQLSGGEQQRVLLAKTLLQVWPELNPHASFLLLDEPLAGLDWHHQIILLTLLNELKRQGLTILTSIHDFNLAVAHSDVIWCLQQGQLVFSDTVDQFNERLIEDVFCLKTIRCQAEGQALFLPWQVSHTTHSKGD
ncbi:ATP-binding cassette domain-containing protein [Tolumonas lignilytica]|uniref:ATP-binding cassette domain-containing protein n=1 Tax=Tolumonas lignilytica TaxID=1283284 RepID=UPI000465489C|nr:ATP-binding cassette domain-containing protein [Tolumonas lignilytica]